MKTIFVLVLALTCTPALAQLTEQDVTDFQRQMLYRRQIENIEKCGNRHTCFVGPRQQSITVRRSPRHIRQWYGRDEW